MRKKWNLSYSQQQLLSLSLLVIISSELERWAGRKMKDEIGVLCSFFTGKLSIRALLDGSAQTLTFRWSTETLTKLLYWDVYASASLPSLRPRSVLLPSQIRVHLTPPPIERCASAKLLIGTRREKVCSRWTNKLAVPFHLSIIVTVNSIWSCRDIRQHQK